MDHIVINYPITIQLKSAEIPRLLEMWRIQGSVLVYRTERAHQSGGFGNPNKHPYVWAVAVMVDGQWTRIFNARGQGREWNNLDRLEKWLRDQGFSRWYLDNPIGQ